ncbi:hypothetical protein Dimus_017957, partial [Dionaea muscipula]
TSASWLRDGLYCWAADLNSTCCCCWTSLHMQLVPSCWPAALYNEMLMMTLHVVALDCIELGCDNMRLPIGLHAACLISSCWTLQLECMWAAMLMVTLHGLQLKATDLTGMPAGFGF